MDIRDRSYYYQRSVKEKTKRTWIPRFVRRFYHQHSRKVLYACMAGSTAVVFNGVFKSIYFKFTMSNEEYDAWAKAEKERFMRFAKYGEGVRIPFTNRTFNMETPDTVHLLEMRDEYRRKQLQKDFIKWEKRLGLPPRVEVSDDD